MGAEIGGGSPTPFGVAWERLEIDDLRRFLAEGPDEGLTWEAKGGDVRPEHVRAAVCAFANSDLGGFLVLGAARAGMREWQVGGWTPRDEPALWVENCVGSGGVSPMPSIAIRTWRLNDDGAQLAVVAVRPVAVPPAVTSIGEVWQRVSGASKRVVDPTILRQLFERGRAAERRAEAAAASGLVELGGGTDFSRSSAAVDVLHRRLAFALSMACPALPDDVSLRLFRESTADRLREILGGPLRGEPLDPRFNTYDFRVDHAGISALSASAFGEGREGYSLRLTRGGAFAVARAAPELEGLSAVGRDPNILRPSWDALVRLATGLGAPAGSQCFLLLWLGDPPSLPVTIRRWTAVAPLSNEALASISREALRATGRLAWEPED